MHVLQTILLSGFRPRAAARANRDTRLRAAYLAHWIGLIVCGLTWLGLLAGDPEIGPDVRWLLSPGPDEGKSRALIWLIAAVVVELAFGLLAFLLLPWGDGRAPLRVVWRHALRTAWLHTGHLALCFVPFVVSIVANDLWFEGRGLINWLPMCFAAGAVWYASALIGAMTVELEQVEERPPTCEACGYNLSYHQNPGDRCPECGRPAEESLGPHVRSPVGWGPFGASGWRTSFVEATLNAWFAPERLFGRTAVTSGLASAGVFLVAHMVLAGTTFFAAICFGSVIMPGGPPNDSWVYYLFACWSAFIGSLTGVAVSLTAAIVGLIVSRQHGRNCLPGAIRVGCFCAGIVPAWVFCEVAAGFVGARLVESVRPWRWGEAILFVGLLGLTGALIVIYVGGVARRMKYVQFANR